MKVRFFEPGKGYLRLKEEMDEATNRVLTNGDLILRKDVEDFEKNLAEFCGTKYAVALNSGTDALYLSLWAYGIGHGDEVLVPSHTFVATAQVVAQLGATPVLYDMDGNFNVSDNTKAIMVAHIAGEFCADMANIMAIAKARDLIVIEDACQSIGAVQGGKKAGAWGHAGAFSFYPAKILGAYGDAGGLVTNDEWLASEVKNLANHYKSDYSQWGINSRLDNLQAAFLNIKMKYLPETLKIRQNIADMYLNNLKGVGLPLNNGNGRVWQDFIVQVNNENGKSRDGLYQFLKENGIETLKNEYPFPIQKLPISLKYESETLRLPINENLVDEEIMYVISKVNEYAM